MDSRCSRTCLGSDCRRYTTARRSRCVARILSLIVDLHAWTAASCAGETPTPRAGRAARRPTARPTRPVARADRGLASSACDDGAGASAERSSFLVRAPPTAAASARRPRRESRTSRPSTCGGSDGRCSIRPVQRQAQLPAVGMLDDHVATAFVIPLQTHHRQRHPGEGMDRQGDGHPLRREVLTRCSVMWSWASSPRGAPADSSGSNTSSRVPSCHAGFSSSAMRPSLGEPQPLLREGRPQQVAAQPLQPRAIGPRHPHVGVQVEPVEMRLARPARGEPVRLRVAARRRAAAPRPRAAPAPRAPARTRGLAPPAPASSPPPAAPAERYESNRTPTAAREASSVSSTSRGVSRDGACLSPILASAVDRSRSLLSAATSPTI